MTKVARRAAKPKARRKAATKKRVLKRARAKRVVKRAVRRASARRVVKKARARRAVKKAVRKRAARGAKRPSLTLVKRAKAAKPKSPRVARGSGKPAGPFAAAKAGASAKDLALFEFVRARVAVHAAVQGMAPASADQPGAPGKWSARETLLHLAYWDHEMWRAVEEAFQHNRRPRTTHEEIERINPGAIAALAHLDWESAKRLVQAHRERLLEALQSIPEEPAEMWSREHAVGWIVLTLTAHDRHHAEALREARARRDRG